ncbi:uncharacterized UDP-glucosyltransferase YdhE-like [Oppia nitens]|uniref:uncharacterized UDP-glucosyltransferase YdhE-like n=1 Tax=Oppia nitens TaxID=1686743 RepID=UPI0023DC6C22|nr:uncharacterized UDP-glucosyltransferase YdhE-like [Oppia nitens]
MSSSKLTVLITPLDGWGHINCCHGIAEELVRRGHRVVFALDVAFKGKLSKYGFEEELFAMHGDVEDKEFWPKWMAENGQILESRDPCDLLQKMFPLGFKLFFENIKSQDPHYREMIARLNPDIIISDNYLDMPAVTDSGKPWIWLYSAGPLNFYKDKRLPPSGSGLPLDGDRQEWKRFADIVEPMYREVFDMINEFSVSKGAPPLEWPHPHRHSPYLNIYMYVNELDYNEVHPLSDNYLRVENVIRHTNDKFEVPEQLRDKPGKLIFLSMGSFGCGYLKLMQRLTSILGKSQHRFIVSKGPLNDMYSLPDNMWGEAFLPQTAVLPLVDLVITHGGNNTVTETFYYGKPMLVLPLFSDQFDNAQRLQETGLGARLSPFYCEEEELIDIVDRMVNDEELRLKMETIGKRIRNTDDKSRVADLVEKLAQK